MKRIPVLVAFLVSLAVLAHAQQTAYYQIELAPSGKLLASDKPIVKGGAYVFHSYPSGTLMSLRPSQIKYIAPVTVDTSDPTYKVVAIGNLAMQGGSTQAGPRSASTVGAKKPDSSGLGTGFYSEIVPGETQAFANSPNDYQVGRTYAYAPSSASQSTPGAPPTNPSATNGANPPMMSGNPP